MSTVDKSLAIEMFDLEIIFIRNSIYKYLCLKLNGHIQSFTKKGLKFTSGRTDQSRVEEISKEVTQKSKLWGKTWGYATPRMAVGGGVLGVSIPRISVGSRVWDVWGITIGGLGGRNMIKVWVWACFLGKIIHKFQIGWELFIDGFVRLGWDWIGWILGWVGVNKVWGVGVVRESEAVEEAIQRVFPSLLGVGVMIWVMISNCRTTEEIRTVRLHLYGHNETLFLYLLKF